MSEADKLTDQEFEDIMEVKVLCVESDPDELRRMTRVLAPKVSHIHCVTNGREGILAFAKYRPDIVVADMVLPKMDGINLTRAIRAMSPGAFIIFTASQDEMESVLSAKSIPFASFVKKPVDPEALLAAVADYAVLVRRDRDLAEHKRLTETMLKSLPDPAMLVERSSRMILFSNQAAQDLGFTEGDISQGPLFPEEAFISPSKTGRFTDYLSYYSSFTKREVGAFNRIFDVSITPAAENGVLICARDVTERKNIESALKEAHDDMERRVEERTSELKKINDELLNVVYERQWAQEALRESEERLRLLVDNMPVLIHAHDDSGLYVFWNKECERATGFTAEQMVGNPKAAEMLYPDPKHRSRYFRQYEQGDYRDVEIPTATADGREITIAWTNISTTCPVPGWAVWETGIDISDRRRMEKELKGAKEAAEESSQAKSIFLANMSHEIRTPLNGILGFTELTLTTDLSDEQRSNLELVRESGNTLLNIINDILDFSKIEAGKLELVEEDMDIEPVVALAEKFFSVLAREKGLELKTEISPEIAKRIKGDPVRLRQVLVNLIGNAVKFTESGTITVSVELADEPPQPDSGVDYRLHFSIADTGPGIKPDKLAVIFDSFTQADESITKKYQGAGLGLAISKRLVQMMGGDIRVESKLGEGSTFHFTAGFAKAGTGRRKRPERPKAQRPTRSLNILLAEDNAVNRLLATRMIEKLGHRVECAATGREALTMLTEKEFDCVLMDVRMPDVDGLEATRRIRSGEVAGVNKDICIIATTAHALKGDRERFLEEGMDDYLPKPFDFARFEKVLAEMAACKKED